MQHTTTAYVWFDSEFTSLELENAHLLQVAVMLTDSHLKRLTPPEDDLNFYVELDPQTPLSPWVKKHIPDLIKKCESIDAVPVDRIDQNLTQFIDQWCRTPNKTIKKRPIMAGNSIHSDWFLARKFFPTFVSRLHYRLLDVSAFKVVRQDWTQGEEFKKDDPHVLKKYFPEAHLDRLLQHDAYYDIIASAAELAFYREQMNFS